MHRETVGEQIEAIMVVLKKTYYGADLQRLITELRELLQVDSSANKSALR